MDLKSSSSASLAAVKYRNKKWTKQPETKLSMRSGHVGEATAISIATLLRRKSQIEKMKSQITGRAKEIKDDGEEEKRLVEMIWCRRRGCIGTRKGMGGRRCGLRFGSSGWGKGIGDRRRHWKILIGDLRGSEQLGLIGERVTMALHGL
ncbi:unnamed protein product [Linum tenue]|uniref:Uncharacterized protein n=1 Tax=Linum tenue TaxID=586396 RepID=A0AAV0L0I0_9ROSI|nr:unnamed protein product [Linum tenue]